MAFINLPSSPKTRRVNHPHKLEHCPMHNHHLPSLCPDWSIFTNLFHKSLKMLSADSCSCNWVFMQSCLTGNLTYHWPSREDRRVAPHTCDLQTTSQLCEAVWSCTEYTLRQADTQIPGNHTCHGRYANLERRGFRRKKKHTNAGELSSASIV